MKAVLLRGFGGTENLEAGEAPSPKPGAGEVLLRVRACALNHLDLHIRNGIPAYKITLPHILGCDVAGEAVEVGPGADPALAGGRFAVAPGRSCGSCDYCVDGRESHCPRYGIIGAQGGPGGYAELLAVPERCLLPIPEGMGFAEAASLPLTFLTAWHMLTTLGGCRAGQTVLVMGAGSGVGVAGIQIARACGARVIAVSTSEEKLAKAKALGAHDIIHSPPQDIVRQTMKLTGSEMADLVFEHVGPAVFPAAIKSLKSGGKLVTCGSTTGPTVEVDMRYVFSRHLQILGSKMGTLKEMRDVWRLVRNGELKPVVDRTFPLAQARAAHDYLAARKQFGKVVLTV